MTRQRSAVVKSSFLSFLHSSDVSSLGSSESDGRGLYVELLSEVFDALRPSSLVEDAKNAAGPTTILQSPRAQGREQRLQTARRRTKVQHERDAFFLSLMN